MLRNPREDTETKHPNNAAKHSAVRDLFADPIAESPKVIVSAVFRSSSGQLAIYLTLAIVGRNEVLQKTALLVRCRRGWAIPGTLLKT
jgi:hypothetical protein